MVTSDYEAHFEKTRYQLNCSGNFSYHLVVDWKLFLDQIKPTATFEILRLALNFKSLLINLYVLLRKPIGFSQLFEIAFKCNKKLIYLCKLGCFEWR